MFVDRVRIHVASGKGGDGCVSFRREKYVPRGGPDGGDGGDGGSVILEARQGVDSLTALAHRKHWHAQSGEPGSGANCHGKQGPDQLLPVPPGTLVRDLQTDLVIKDLQSPGDRVIAARGGKGGKGNARFKSSTNRTPREFTRGGSPESRELELELKLIADVGLLGKPNAGKSTLLSRLSRARPQIADYPFTTKVPHLGIVSWDQDHSFVMADIPGLIAGAHRGTGLGHEFLRHVERTRLLVHLVEPEPMDGSDPWENYRQIRDELAHYQHGLAERTEIVAVTKSELPSADQVRNQLSQALRREVLGISAVTGAGLSDLKRALAAALSDAVSSESLPPS